MWIKHNNIILYLSSSEIVKIMIRLFNNITSLIFITYNNISITFFSIRVNHENDAKKESEIRKSEKCSKSIFR